MPRHPEIGLILHTPEDTPTLTLIPEDPLARDGLIWSPLAPQWTLVPVAPVSGGDLRIRKVCAPHVGLTFFVYPADVAGWPLISAARRMMEEAYRALGLASPRVAQDFVRTQATPAITELLGGPHNLSNDPAHLGRLIARPHRAPTRWRPSAHGIWL